MKEHLLRCLKHTGLIGGVAATCASPVSRIDPPYATLIFAFAILHACVGLDYVHSIATNLANCAIVNALIKGLLFGRFLFGESMSCGDSH